MVRARYKVTFTAGGVGSVTAILDETPPTVTGGYGGWETVPRPRRKALTQWNGRDPFRMEIPILFDGYSDRDGQEIAVSTLSRMAQPHGSEPPVVKVAGRGVPDPGPDNWVIEELAWGNSKVIQGFNKSGSMVRLRSDCIVHLLEHVAEDRAAFARLAPAAGSWPKHYTVKRGDTLQKISSKFYHTSKKWKRIATANNIRDPRHPKVGRVLIIPAP